jgi:anion-transporting  ArsA/GET3 family ATPase
VLLVELERPAGAALLLGHVPSRPGEPVSTQLGVDLAYYQGEAALAEYVTSFLPFGDKLDAVFSHPLYRAFVDSGPGVRELMVIGKVRDELLGLRRPAPLYDVLVLDAGSSGHALQMLEMPTSVAGAFSRGLAHREATGVRATLADARTTAVHVVAAPEEMPLAEAAEVVAKLTAQLGLPLGHLIVNFCRPIAPAGSSEAVGSLREHGVPESLSLVAESELTSCHHQERGIAALEERTAQRVLRLPRLSAVQLEASDLLELAAVIEEEPG